MNNMRKTIYHYKKLLLFLILALAVSIFPTAARAQKKPCVKPVTLSRLKVNLQNKSFNTRQIVDTINDCGADFQLTPPVEAQLVAAGARPQVIEAVRNNYRAVVAAISGGNLNSKSYAGAAVKKDKLLSVLKNKSVGSGTLVDAIEKNGVDFQITPAVEKELTLAGATPAIIIAAKTNYRSGARVVSGNPLTKDAIVTLLENGVADAQVQANVKNRGVNFKLNAQTTQEIKTAGGSPVLIKLLGLAYVVVGSNNNTSAGNSGNPTATVGYDDLVEQAIETFNADAAAKQPVGSAGRLKAIGILKNAVQMDAENPSAYQQLGYMTLYGTKGNFADAEQYMQKAVALGGSAVLRVYHDHDGLFNNVCQGSLYISKDGVRFESDDNKHTFNTTDENILKVKMNNGFKQMFQTKAGSFQIVLKSEDKDGTKYSFAPLTNSAEESKIAIRLIGKN